MIKIVNKKDKEEVHKIVANAVHEVVIPALESMEERLTEKMATKEDIDRLERKLDTQQDRLDRHGERIQVLETATS